MNRVTLVYAYTAIVLA